MRFACVLALVSLAACEAKLGGRAGDDDALDLVDAPTVTNEPPIDAPACFNGRVVYLNFDGVALTRGAASDATLNRASWMQIASGSAPIYRAGDGNRVAQITEIIDGVRAALEQFPITVVTTRPTSGEYVMIVYGGTAAQVGSRFSVAVQELDCGDLQRNDVGWMSDANTGIRAINNTLGAIGFGLGLTATTDPNDCMCSWDNQCTPDQTKLCTLTPGIARDPNARQRCAGLTQQDEVATFRTGFCQ
ncbi:MAG: hypothetical protein KF773_12840 [Deltaproteobacteria bacterium]|nr:hypothetical protein [Deltaproteobacteria bacterium]MCW5801468.1 hypothetical protein [Deltaproteobacteria bacterium]